MADNVNLIVNETIENIVINPSITTEVIDITVLDTTEVIDISVTPNLTVVNINQVTGGGGSDIVVQDEGNERTNTLKSLNFTGTGVLAYEPINGSGDITVVIPGLPTTGLVASVIATSPITSSGGNNPVISTNIAPNTLVGRKSGGAPGVMEQITLGTNLSLTTTGILNAVYPSPGLIEVVPPLIVSGGTDQIISTSVYPGRLMGRADNGNIGPMQEIQVGTGLSLSAGGVLANTSITPVQQGYYGAFQDMLTQTIATANVDQPFLIRTTDENNHVTITQNGAGEYTRITPEYTGVYNIQWSGQFQNPTQFIHDVNVWFRKGFTSNTGNGTDIIGSNGVIALPARKSASAGEDGHTVSGWNFLLTINAGEYVEFYWMSNSADVTLQAYAAGNPPPSTASLIVTVTQQAGVMAGVTPILTNVLNAGRVVNQEFFLAGSEPPEPYADSVMTINNNTFNYDTELYIGTGIFAGGKTGIEARGYGDGANAIKAYSELGDAITAISGDYTALNAFSSYGTAIIATSAYNGVGINAYGGGGYAISAIAINSFAAQFIGGSEGGITIFADSGTLIDLNFNNLNTVGLKSRGNVEGSANHIECYTELGTTPVFKVNYYGNIETPQVTTDRIYKTQPTIVTITTTPTTLTYTNISAGIIRTAASGTVALTLPTGASMQTMGIPLNKGFDWNIINSSAGSTTLTGALGHTIVGSTSITASTSATLRTVQTALNTYITYRIN